MNETSGLAVVALSGGMDSCVSAAIAREKYDLALLHVKYGQRTEKKELRAFYDIADYYDIQKRLVIDLSHLAAIGNSALTDKNIEIREADLTSRGVPASYVPFRNANILAACISWAEALNADTVIVGAVYEDSSGYPDCRPEFFKAFEAAANLGTKPETNIRIITPVINFSKEEIVKKGIELNAPLHLTWSCYKNEDEACGVCDSCALRLRGFHKAGYTDPLKYKERPVYF